MTSSLKNFKFDFSKIRNEARHDPINKTAVRTSRSKQELKEDYVRDKSTQKQRELFSKKIGAHINSFFIHESTYFPKISEAC